MADLFDNEMGPPFGQKEGRRRGRKGKKKERKEKSTVARV
jgi:hypothetical protein